MHGYAESAAELYRAGHQHPRSGCCELQHFLVGNLVELAGGRHHAGIRSEDTVHIGVRNKRIHPRSLNQRDYIQKIRRHDMVFSVGPAGTGKTYLAIDFDVARFRHLAASVRYSMSRILEVCVKNC